MRTRLIFVVIAGMWLSGAVAVADERVISAYKLFHELVTHDLALAEELDCLQLEAGVLYEDDGPAAGYSYQPNEERLSDKVWIKKELIIPNPEARGATLLSGPVGIPNVRINGQEIALPEPKAIGRHWTSFAIPPDVLRAGKNEIVLHGSGRVWISRAEDFAKGSDTRAKHPNRSARSADGGLTWDYDHLGPNGDIDGEYNVRLYLDQFRPSGSVMTGVIDIANLVGQPIAPSVITLGSVKVTTTVKQSDKGKVVRRLRSGSTPQPDRTWTDWMLPQQDDEYANLKGRYLQVAVDLSTDNPLVSPQLNELRIVASPTLAKSWTDRLKVLEIHNEQIVRSAIPFTYEAFDNPQLKELRSRYKLDDVVAGAKDEFELMTRLASWSARQWEKGHLGASYPAWNALEILKPHADGTPVGGFCQQYNIVLLQACASFGIPGRALSISTGDHGKRIPGSGHEVVELWSNQYRKWIYLDGNMAWYAVDAAKGTPLSLWELRQRQLLAIENKPHQPIRVVELPEARKHWTSLTEWPPFLELLLIPRSNFLGQPLPLPLHQGMRGWFWTGHHAWSDTEHPASLLYSHRESNPHNFEWTLNQAHLTLEATKTPGTLQVFLETETPGFEAFVVTIDDQPDRVDPATTFEWKLHPGRNSLAVRPRNIAGRDGIVSRVVIEQP